MIEDKNQLAKLYSINGYSNYIEFNDIQKFYCYDPDTKSFKYLNQETHFNSNIHCVLIEANNSSSSKK